MKKLILCVFMALLSFSSYAESADTENETPKKSYSDFLDPNYYSKKRKKQTTNAYTGLTISAPTIETTSIDATAKNNNSFGFVLGVKANEYVGFEFGYKQLNSNISYIHREVMPVLNYKARGKMTSTTGSIVLLKNISVEDKKHKTNIFISYGTGSYSSKYSGIATQGTAEEKQELKGSGNLTRIAVGMDIKFKENFHNNGTKSVSKIRINFYEERAKNTKFSNPDVSDEDYIDSISGLEFGFITEF